MPGHADAAEGPPTNDRSETRLTRRVTRRSLSRLLGAPPHTFPEEEHSSGQASVPSALPRNLIACAIAALAALVLRNTLSTTKSWMMPS